MLCNTNTHSGFPDKILQKNRTNQRQGREREYSYVIGIHFAEPKHMQNARDMNFASVQLYYITFAGKGRFKKMQM